MQARCAGTRRFAINARPASNNTALVPFSVALRAGKYANCSGIELAADELMTINRAASFW